MMQHRRTFGFDGLLAVRQRSRVLAGSAVHPGVTAPEGELNLLQSLQRNLFRARLQVGDHDALRGTAPGE